MKKLGSQRCSRLRLEHLLRQLRALPTIRVHPKLDGRTLDIDVHSLKLILMAKNSEKKMLRSLPRASIRTLHANSHSKIAGMRSHFAAVSFDTAVQTNKTWPIKYENKKNVLSCLIECLMAFNSNFIKHDQTRSNTIKQH